MLKGQVAPIVEKVLLDEESKEKFETMMLKMEAHLFAHKEFRERFNENQKEYVNSHKKK